MLRIVIIVSTFLFFCCSNGYSQNTSISVHIFQNLTGNDSNDWIGVGFADTLVATIGKISELRLIETNELNKLLKAMKLSLSGLVDEETTIKAGRIIGAKFLIMGSYQIVADKLMVSYRMVETETGKILFSESVEGNSEEILELEKTISKNVTGNIKKQFPELHIEQEAVQKIKSKSASVNYAKGLTCYLKSDLDKGIGCFQQVIDEDPGFADAYLGQGDIYLSKKDASLALEKFRQALSIYQANGDRFFIGWTYYKIGEAYYIQGEFDKSIDYYTKALQIKEKINRDIHVPGIYNRLSEIAHQQGQISKAIKYARKSVKAYKKLGNKHSQIESLVNLTTLYEESNLRSSAIKTIENAIKICKEEKCPGIDKLDKIRLGLGNKTQSK